MNIEDALQELSDWFDTSTGDIRRLDYISKLATIEFCGWIESELDCIVIRAGATCGVEPSWLEKDVILKTYGFTYKDHLRQMLVKVYGHHFVTCIEMELENHPNGNFSQLKNLLGDLASKRNKLAHTQLDFQQKVADAPSISLSNLKKLRLLLIDFETQLQNMLSTIPDALKKQATIRG